MNDIFTKDEGEREHARDGSLYLLSISAFDFTLID